MDMLQAARLHALLQKAEAGELSLAELHAGCPIPANESDAFLKQVLADLEDAVERMPGKLFTGEVDLVAWRSSEAYRSLVADRKALELYGRRSSAVLMERRRRSLRGEDWPP